MEMVTTRKLDHSYRSVPDREGLLDTPKRAAEGMRYLCKVYWVIALSSCLHGTWPVELLTVNHKEWP